MSSSRLEPAGSVAGICSAVNVAGVSFPGWDEGLEQKLTTGFLPVWTSSKSQDPYLPLGCLRTVSKRGEVPQWPSCRLLGSEELGLTLLWGVLSL